MSHDGKGIRVGLLVACGLLSAYMEVEGEVIFISPEVSWLPELKGHRSYVLLHWWGYDGMLHTIDR